MEKRILTNLSEETSRLGMGLMRLPLQEDGKIDYPAAEAVIDRLMEGGVRYYDTAWFYHEGQSELFAQKALVARYPRDSFTLATKLPLGELDTLEEAERVFDRQRENIGVETIDFYLLHGINLSGWEKAVRLGIDRKLREWKAAGKIRQLGFSFHGDAGDLAPILDAYKPDFVQIQLNYYDWEEGSSKILYEAAVERGVAVIVMEPVRGGGLTRFPQPILNLFTDASPASYALRWCASLPGVDVVLSGMSSLRQAEENIRTFEGDTTLSIQDHALIRRVMEEYRRLPLIPCTGCNYCNNCPQGIEIARHFGGANEKIGLGGSWFLDNYKMLVPEGRRVSDCVACGACEKICPQGIGIIEELKKIAASGL